MAASITKTYAKSYANGASVQGLFRDDLGFQKTQITHKSLRIQALGVNIR